MILFTNIVLIQDLFDSNKIQFFYIKDLKFVLLVFLSLGFGKPRANFAHCREKIEGWFNQSCRASRSCQTIRAGV